MRLIRVALVAALSSTILLACAKSGSNGPQGPTIADKAKSGQFDQAVVDDLKAAQAQSTPVLPDSSILTDKDPNHESQRQESIKKLNAIGLAWLAVMQQKCAVQTTQTGNPQGQGHSEATTTVSGNGCPISMNTVEVHDTTVSQDQKSAIVDGHMSSNESVVDQTLVQESGFHQMNALANFHGDLAQNSTHIVANGTVDAQLTSSNIHLDFQMEMSHSQQAQSSAIAMTVTSPHGSSSFGIVSDGTSTHYYMGSKEVPADEFNHAMGGIVPTF